MANVIRHKRGTTNPAAGNFSQTAELLVNTSDGGVFTKTDGGSVVEVGSNASNLSTGTVPSGRLSGSYGISVTGSSASCTGNAASATVLQTARTIALGGDLSGSASFNGSANITITAAVADDSHNHVVSNIDGLQTTLNDKASLTSAQTFTLAQRGQVDALSSAATITPNFANSNNFSISLSTNTTIANPSNLVAGQSGAIAISYNGSYTVAFGSYWKFAGGTAPTATSTSGKVDVLVYYVESSTRISAQLLLNMGG